MVRILRLLQAAYFVDKLGIDSTKPVNLNSDENYDSILERVEGNITGEPLE